MKLVSVLFIAFFVAGAFAAQEETDVANLVQQMENSKFGKTILQTIQLSLSAGDPVDDLILTLQEIEDKVIAEQKEDDDFIQALSAACDADLALLQSEIDDAANRAAELQAELDEKIPIRDEKVRLLAEKMEFKALIEAKIVELDQNKVLKEEEWAQEQEEHDKAQFVIEKAKQVIVAALQGGDSFLQKKKNVGAAFAQLSDHFTSEIKRNNFKKQGWVAVFKVLAQMTSAEVQADSGAVEEFIELCDQLLNKIAESREIERRDYQNWMEEYEVNREGQVARLDETKAQIANLELEIAALTKRINNATIERDEQYERQANKQSQYDDRYKYCEDEERGYGERRQIRDENRTVVSNAIALLTSHARTFKKYVEERTG